MVAVRVTAPQFSSVQKAAKLFGATNRLLRKADPSIPLVPFPEASFEFRHEFYGEQYAMYTNEAMAAVRQLRDLEGVKLEGTYTGKTFAAVSADAQAGRLRGKTVLFWNTYNSTDFSAEIADVDYHVLPKPFHRYFEQDVQPLDRDNAH
jgi:D-cysteine desulfhydrase